MFCPEAGKFVVVLFELLFQVLGILELSEQRLFRECPARGVDVFLHRLFPKFLEVLVGGRF
jgi:hypothetical protein